MAGIFPLQCFAATGTLPVCKIARFLIAILRKTLLSVDMHIPTSLKIFPMTSLDIDAVMEIEKVSFPRPWLREFFEKELESPISYCFVAKAVLDGREIIAGYMVFWIVDEEAHILNIAVTPELRNMGLAKKLLSFSLEFMLEKGVVAAYLEVRTSNEAAKKLYARFGFKDLYVRKKYYGSEDAVVMMLDMEEFEAREY
ncbi:MAG: ribosomal protein S18-alanine N-acetyltransferase [Thermodesulfobacteriota bacterium]